jgi:4'-phosphopantetheinyl transferase EntD
VNNIVEPPPPRTPQLSMTLAALFPAAAVVAELEGSGDAAWLLPAEQQFLGRAVPKRVAEFAAGRACARRALAAFGLPAIAIAVGENRQPLWPDGFAGSITHTAGFCAAVVARSDELAGLGLDSERVGQIARELWPSICVASELTWLASVTAARRDAAATLLFSAKEAFYKMQYPLTGQWLGFHDVECRCTAWNEGSGSFEILPRKSIDLERHAQRPVRGHFCLHGAFLTAAAVLGPR